MHSHQGLQEQALLSAPLIIRERREGADRQDVVLLLHDFSFKSPQEIYAGLRHVTSSAAGQSMDGMAGNGMQGMGAMPGMAKVGEQSAGMALDSDQTAVPCWQCSKERASGPGSCWRRQPGKCRKATGALHCRSGCTLGDIAAEWLVFLVPSVAVWFGWHGLFGQKMFADWIIDCIFAYAFGIVFQYCSIVPMRGLSVWPASGRRSRPTRCR